MKTNTILKMATAFALALFAMVNQSFGQDDDILADYQSYVDALTAAFGGGRTNYPPMPPIMTLSQFESMRTMRASAHSARRSSPHDVSPEDSPIDPLSTWNLCNTNAAYNLTGIMYGNGLYVATGTSGTLLTSRDAITWATNDIGTSLWLFDVAYGNNTFVTTGQSGTIYSSPDGITWTARSSGITADFYRMGFFNGLFIAVGTQQVISTSSDGITWSTQQYGEYTHANVKYGNGLYVVADAYEGAVITSPDAVTWTTRDATVKGSLAFGNGLFVLSAFAGDGSIATSPDGITWSSVNVSPPPSSGFNGMDYGQGSFVGCGGYGQIICSSPDGTNWTQQYSGGAGVALWNVRYLNGTFIAVGDNGVILQSGYASQFINECVNAASTVQTTLPDYGSCPTPTATGLVFITHGWIDKVHEAEEITLATNFVY
jgi:hypothetical protein